MPNCRGLNSGGVLVKFVQILKRGGLFLGQNLIKVEPNKPNEVVKWTVKMCPKWNLSDPYH